MYVRMLVCVATLVLGAGRLAVAPAAGVAASVGPPSVAALAETFKAQGLDTAGLESRLVALCAGPSPLGDVAEAFLVAGYDVFTVVRDTILACGKGGKGTEVAAEVASRALLVKGPAARPLIDAGVLAAAAEIAQRRQTPTVARVAVPTDDQAKRDRERERLERMMQKGLIDDEYREYIEERRRVAEQMVPAALPEQDFVQEAIYSNLYNLGLVGGGFYGDVLVPHDDPGAAASDR